MDNENKEIVAILSLLHCRLGSDDGSVPILVGNNIMENIQSVRGEVQSILFDLEATKRENAYLRKILENVEE